jgi:hypothetical protein
MSAQKVSAIESIQGVMDKVSGVAKREKNAQQGFSFRGIDAVVNAIAPALREVGGVVVPTILEKTYDRGVTKSGTPTVECFLTVAFDWYGTDGTAPIRGVVCSEAMDTSDKATAKAMSVAYRTYLLQTLMLPTDEKDPDADYHERGATKTVPADFLALIESATTLDELNALYAQAGQEGFQTAVKPALSKRKKDLVVPDLKTVEEA